MSDGVYVPSRTGGTWPWVAAALAAGAIAGAAVARGPVSPLALVALIAGSALVVASFWRLELGLLAIIFTLPLDQYGRVLTSPVTVTVFQLMLLVSLASWAVRIVGDPRGFLRFSAIDIGIGALLLAGLWSLPSSLAPQATLTAIVRVAFLWAFTLLFANGIREEKTARHVLAALAVSGVVVGLIGLAQYFLPGFHFGSVRDVLKAGGGVAISRVGALFYDPNYLAGMLSAIFAAALAMLMRAQDRARVLGWGLACAVTGSALLVTFSRGGWVGGFVGVVAVALTAPKGRRLVLGGAVGAALLAVLIAKPDLILSRTMSIADIQRDRSVATRFYMTDSALDMISDHPVFGVGLGAFDQSYPYYRRPYTSPTIVKPHQVPLAIWAETGLAGLLAQIALAAGLVALFWRRRPRGWTALESAAVAGAAAILVQTLFEYYLYFEYVWLFLALSVVATRLARQDEGERS